MLSCIKYSVKLNITASDIKYYFFKNKRLFYLFTVFIFLGIIAGIIISSSSKSYLSLLSGQDNILVYYINGDIDFVSQIIKLISKNITLFIVLFVLNLSFWSGLASFLVMAYQSSVIYLSLVALCTQFGVKGFVTIIFVFLPINLCLLIIDTILAVSLFKRSLYAYKTKSLWYDFDNINFWKIPIILMIMIVIFSIAINILLALILRSSAFILF